MYIVKPIAIQSQEWKPTMCDNEGNTEISRQKMASGVALVVTSVFQAALRKEIICDNLSALKLNSFSKIMKG